MAENRQTPANERQLYGGQAVVEGVMMRSPRYFAVACRRQSGEVVVERENVESVTKKWAWLNKPFLRGMLALVDAFYMGAKALMYSANIQAADVLEEPQPLRMSEPEIESEARAASAVDLAIGQGIVPAHPDASGSSAAPAGSPAINGIVIGGTVVFSLLVGMGLFWGVPTLITQALQDHVMHVHGLQTVTRAQGIELNCVDGIIRIAIFLAYIGGISLMSNVKRVFMYHGAEHKAINTLEANLPLTVENARNASRLHPRCGTNFIFIVLITAIFVFSIFPRPPFWLERMGLHLLLVPFVAGVSFEILKFAGKYRDKSWARLLIAPGLMTQYLTTRAPDDSQIEVALAALESVWEKEHETDIKSDIVLDVPEPAAAVA